MACSSKIASPASCCLLATIATHLLGVVSKCNGEGLGRYLHSLFITFQSTVLILQGFIYVRRALPLAILGSVFSMLIAFGDSFLP